MLSGPPAPPATRWPAAGRYVESSPYPCLVVVSEDGMVDVLTKENLAETRQ